MSDDKMIDDHSTDSNDRSVVGKLDSDKRSVSKCFDSVDDYKWTPAGRSVASKYSDIIDLSRPELHHQRMDILNRAKIFAPFDALRGFDEEIQEVDKETSVDKSEIYSDDLLD
jgi:hypothetical protein